MALPVLRADAILRFKIEADVKLKNALENLGMLLGGLNYMSFALVIFFFKKLKGFIRTS